MIDCLFWLGDWLVDWLILMPAFPYCSFHLSANFCPPSSCFPSRAWCLWSSTGPSGLSATTLDPRRWWRRWSCSIRSSCWPSWLFPAWHWRGIPHTAQLTTGEVFFPDPIFTAAYRVLSFCVAAWKRSWSSWWNRLPLSTLSGSKLLLRNILLQSAGECVCFGNHSNECVRLDGSCVFLPDNGAIYVNLMITTAFVGGGTRLLRLGQLFFFLLRFFCCARSEAERYILTRVWPPFFQRETKVH